MGDRDKTRARLLQELADAHRALAALDEESGQLDKASKPPRGSWEEQRVWLETLNDIPYSMDTQGVITYLGPQATRYGLDPIEMVSRTFLEFVALEDRQRVAQELQLTMTTGREFPTEFRVRASDGQVYWLEDRGMAQRDESGKPVGVVGLLRDITQRKRDEELTRLQRDLAVALNAETKIEEALALCMKIAMRVSGMDSAGVYLADGNGGAELAAHQGLSDDFIQSVDYISPDSEQATLMMAGRPLYVQPESTAGIVEESCRPEGLKALAVLPIEHQGRIIACMNVASHRFAELPGSVRHGLEAIAANLGGTIARLQAEGARRESEETLKSTIASMDDLLFVLDDSGTFVGYYQPTTKADLYVPSDQFLGKPFAEVLPPSLAQPLEDACRSVRADGKSRRVEYPLEIEGQARWFSACVSARKNGKGEPDGFTIVSRDVTEQKNAENALRMGKETLKALLDATTESAFLLELDGTVIAANKTAAERLNTCIEELTGKCVYDYLLPSLAEGRRLLGQQVVSSGKPARLRDEREGRCYESQVYPIHDKAGKVYRMAVYAQDVTDRRQAEEELKAEQQLLRRLFDLQERERKLISHEIHDGLVQDVIGCQMAMDTIRAISASKGAPMPEEWAVARQLLDRAIGEARRMISELRPMIIDEQGVLEAINYLVAQESTDTGPRVVFHHDVQFDRLDPILEGTIFRIVQEALNNAKRHSQSETVEISLKQADTLRLQIRDDGVGFDPTQVHKDRFGLRGIRERARLFGGCATIDSAAGDGTCVTVELPMRQELLDKA